MPEQTRRRGKGQRLRPAPKGRSVDPQAHATVLQLLGDEPRRPDLLIEHLHRLQDAFGQLGTAHLTALAFEMNMTPAEVFEVASFYHHFDIVRDGQDAPARVTVRVCESVSCHMAGADALLETLRGLGLTDTRVLPAPCVGRCDRAPVAVVGRNPIDRATAAAVEQAVSAGRTEPALPDAIPYAQYRWEGGYTDARRLREREDQRRRLVVGAGGVRAARSGWRGFSDVPQVRFRACAASNRACWR